jgi:FeoB-associated Cys-rich membrane protein
MTFQEIVVIAVVLLATLYWLSIFVKMSRGSGKGCGSGCAKCNETPVETTGGRIRLL